jgi:cold shock CspA family protein
MKAQQQLQVGDEYEGQCITWRESQGFGFIRVPGVQRDVFAHRHSLTNAQWLNAGDRVRFSLEMAPDGRLRARHCELLPENAEGRA